LQSIIRTKLIEAEKEIKKPTGFLNGIEVRQWPI